MGRGQALRQPAQLLRRPVAEALEHQVRAVGRARFGSFSGFSCGTGQGVTHGGSTWRAATVD